MELMEMEMETKSKTIKLITHNGSFHADDIFAAATLSLMLEKRGESFKIIRTRNHEIINKGDYVFDVGGIYDEKTDRFDHHQLDFKEKRENNILYSSFGLVWKKYGKELCGSEKVKEIIDNKLVISIDANDNGVDLCKNNFENILPYTVIDVFSVFSPTALENMEKDTQFLKVFAWAKEILKREVKKANDQIEIKKIIQNFYQSSYDKRLIVIDTLKVSRYEIWDALQEFSEPLFIVYSTADDWRIVAMRSNNNSFKNRKDFPKTWASLRDEEFQKISKVSDAIFCHRGLFLAGVKSKEGAITLAQKALLEPSN